MFAGVGAISRADVGGTRRRRFAQWRVARATGEQGEAKHGRPDAETARLDKEEEQAGYRFHGRSMEWRLR
jgi:hypothetical protein